MRTHVLAAAIAILASSTSLSGLALADAPPVAPSLDARPIAEAPTDAPFADTAATPSHAHAPQLSIDGGLGGGRIGGAGGFVTDLTILHQVGDLFAIGGSLFAESRLFSGSGEGASALGGVRYPVNDHLFLSALLELGAHEYTDTPGLLEVGQTVSAVLPYAGGRASIDVRFGSRVAFDLGLTGMLGTTLTTVQTEATRSACLFGCSPAASEPVTIGGSTAVVLLHLGISFDETMGI